MNNDLIIRIEYILQKIVINYYKDKSKTIFDEFIKFCQEYYDGPAHTLAEIKLKQNTKIKGDVFEHFAYKYLQHAYTIKFDNIWLLKDAPDEVLVKLNLRRNDLGIDLLAEKGKKYYAVQAKYRKRGYKTHYGISWKQLSIFYGLISRSGPYEKCIVITNADFVRHIGRKTKQDQSICYGRLNKIDIGSWVAMANFTENSVGNGANFIENSVGNSVDITNTINNSTNTISTVDNVSMVKTTTITTPTETTETTETIATTATTATTETTAITATTDTPKKILIKKKVPDNSSHVIINTEKIANKPVDIDLVRQKRLAYFSNMTK